MVVTIETHPQAEGCLQDNKLATQVDLNSTDGCDRWDHHCPVDLKNREKLITIMDRECKEEKIDIVHMWRHSFRVVVTKPFMSHFLFPGKLD